MACVRALFAVDRATRRARIICTAASLAWGIAEGSPERTANGGGLGICRIGLASESPRLAIGSDHLDHDLAVGAEMTRERDGVAAGAFRHKGAGSAV